jgi:hypothetical protein
MKTTGEDRAATVAGDSPPKGHRRKDGLTWPQYKWIQGVVNGKGLVEAFGSRLKSDRQREARALRYLRTRAIRNRLVNNLLLSGQVERAQSIVAQVALQAALKLIDSGDARTALALMPKARARPAKRASPTSAVDARESE